MGQTNGIIKSKTNVCFIFCKKKFVSRNVDIRAIAEI